MEFPTENKEISTKKNFDITRFSPQNKEFFHLRISPGLYIRITPKLHPRAKIRRLPKLFYLVTHAHMDARSHFLLKIFRLQDRMQEYHL